ncbi:MAG: hypothetical protein KKE20_02190 [Nanoarchaeota archaeon]|nr:hypothetical protein [Nanoarchaeota archaeon]
MNLTPDEKKVIKIALEKHLEEVQGHEDDVGQDIRELAIEVNYEDFVKSIIKKM